MNETSYLEISNVSNIIFQDLETQLWNVKKEGSGNEISAFVKGNTERIKGDSVTQKRQREGINEAKRKKILTKNIKYLYD